MADRVPLYLLPGLLCDDVVWTAQVEALTAQGVECHVVDYKACDTITAMARTVLDQAPGRFAVAGHSMGGRVALEIMRLAASRVDRVALLDTGVHPRQPNEAQKRHALLALARAEGMGALAAIWLPPMVHPDRLTDQVLMTLLTQMVGRKTPEIFAAQVNALLERPDGVPVLGAIKCPALVGVGRYDAWSPPAQHEEIAAAIGTDLVIFEDSGHMVTVEVPEAVTAALARWLEL
ncbi:MAG TPA: alpha/beta hydrolase [Stellaceae bacterium]|jgi:pimeloyl-ACP methyl ester carboxylesterase|nr:alpha/beta hydrolase [Stellaceae bacterium]